MLMTVKKYNMQDCFSFSIDIVDHTNGPQGKNIDLFGCITKTRISNKDTVYLSGCCMSQNGLQGKFFVLVSLF